MTYTDPYSNVPQPILTIFGANGNLAQQKLLPSLYTLIKSGHLTDRSSIVCVALEPIDKESLLQKLEIHLLRTVQECDSEVIKKLGEMMTVLQMDLQKSEDYLMLAKVLENLDIEDGDSVRNRLYYMAIPPVIFHDVLRHLHDAKLHEERDGSAVRMLIEKPFGTDLASAREIVEFMADRFHEKQIYRIDHYLAKETARNILTFRSQNPLIEDIWGRQYIDHIQISVLEKEGVGWRSAFYEKTGALRDMIQSHALQLVSLIMMEVPLEMTAESLHAEKQTLLDAILPMKDNHVDDFAIRGQYASYRGDVQNPSSNIETYAAIKLEVTNSRWGGVPVLIRTGKGLCEKFTEIKLVFKDRSRRNVQYPNILTIRIQPNEGISLQLLAKQPGFTESLQQVYMDFSYATSFTGKQLDAYERVLMDAMIGDQSLFATSKEVLRSWEIVDPIIKAWQNSTEQPELYEAGSNGPAKADALVREFGSEWLEGREHVCSTSPEK